MNSTRKRRLRYVLQTLRASLTDLDAVRCEEYEARESMPPRYHEDNPQDESDEALEYMGNASVDLNSAIMAIERIL